MDTLENASPINDKIHALDKYNALITKTRGMLFSGLGYEDNGGLFYNKAYFSVGQKITEEYIQEQLHDGEKIIQELDAINHQIEDETILNNAQKQLLKKIIEGSTLSIKYHQHAIYIEAEKAGYPLSNKDKSFHRKEIVKIEEALYGKDINQRIDRKNKVISKLHEVYMQNSKDLNEQEKCIWKEKILDAFTLPTRTKEANARPEEKNVYIDEKHIFALMALLLEIEGFKKDDIVKIQIDENAEKAYFNTNDDIYHIPSTWKNPEIYDYFDSLGIGQKFKVIKKTKKGNSVDIKRAEKDVFMYNAINIASPDKNGKYNITKEILPIMYDHETSTHMNTGIGNFKNINLKGGNRSDLEEGIALLNQTLTSGNDIERLYEASIGDIGLFLGENFDEQEVQELLTIYYKLTKEKTQSVQDRTRRIKMGVPIGEKGARKQDLTYGNSKEIIKKLEELTKTPEGIELLNTYARVIYSTKLGYEALENIDEILDGIKSLDELEPNFPIFAGKIIYWKLFKGKLDTDKMLEHDIRRHIHTDQKITNSQKRLLVKILNIIKEHGEEEK